MVARILLACQGKNSWKLHVKKAISFNFLNSWLKQRFCKVEIAKSWGCFMKLEQFRQKIQKKVSLFKTFVNLDPNR